MSFSKRLKQAMAELNINQVALSKMTGIGKPSISQYLSGKNKPSPKNIKIIADALECPIDLLNGSQSIEKADSTSESQILRNVSVKEAARRLGKSTQFIRVGLQTQRLPIGTAVMISTQWTYHISPKLLDEYIGKEGTEQE